MPTAHPPVSQSEWDAALAAMTERERMVAAEMHELAAAPKRMPMERGGWARGVFDDGTMRLIDETYQRADAFLFGRRARGCSRQGSRMRLEELGSASAVSRVGGELACDAIAVTS